MRVFGQDSYLEELGEITQQALKEMRLLVHELRSPALEQEGPVGALQQRLEAVDGTSKGCEHAIGWWIKERYRTMRGYKCRKSAVNVSRLLASSRNHLKRGGADLALLIA